MKHSCQQFDTKEDGSLIVVIAADYPACKPVASKSPLLRRFASRVVSRL